MYIISTLQFKKYVLGRVVGVHKERRYRHGGVRSLPVHSGAEDKEFPSGVGRDLFTAIWLVPTHAFFFLNNTHF